MSRLCTHFIRSGSVLACAAFAGLLAVTPSHAALIVDDSWADGGRTNGADALDTGWWTTTTSSAIEVSVGSMGLVSGSSGRGIHGTFPVQTPVNVGEALKVTFTFTTPATIGTGNAGFKIGLFNTLGNAGLAADLSASSSSPNPIYNPLPGYMMDFDVNTADANIAFREKSPVPGSTGQLLGTTTGFVTLGSGGALYSFVPNTTYTAEYMITKTAGGLDLLGSLSDGSGLLSSAVVSDATVGNSSFDMLGFHANSGMMGSSNAVNTPNNGIDFSNIKIEFIVPEPSAISLLGLAAVGLLRRRNSRV